MANVLSQEEVDSLLKGIGEGQVETETDDPETEEGLRLHVFGKEGGPIHLQMPALGIINERFANLLNISLTNSLGTVIDVNVTDSESVKYGEFCRSLPVPSSLNIFRMEPLRGSALLVMEGSLVFGFVETFNGGKTISQYKLEGKTFTPIEKMIIERSVSIILDSLQQAWSDIHTVNLLQTKTEDDPHLAGIATPDDMIVVNRFTVDFGNFVGAMTVCLPYATIDPIREVLRSKFRGEQLEVDQGWRRAIERGLTEMAINLTCTLGTARISSKQLLEMRPGEVIELDRDPRHSVTVSMEGRPKFTGIWGQRNGKWAVRVSEKITKE